MRGKKAQARWGCSSPRLTLARNGIDATTQVVSYRTAISIGRNVDKMGLRELLSIPKLRRRKKSKARSEIGPIEGSSTVDPSTPRLTGSTPDLRIGSSSSATQSPLTSPGQEFEGTKPDLSRINPSENVFAVQRRQSQPNPVPAHFQ